MATTDDDFFKDDRHRRSGLFRSRSLPQLSHHDSGLGSYYGGSATEDAPAARAARLVADLRQLLTLKQHYYPEGKWGWVVLWAAILVHIFGNGFMVSVGIFELEAIRRFGSNIKKETEFLGALSTGIALFVSPFTITICHNRSTRIIAVMGGLISALGCLFTSFATQFHQLFFSYGTVVGIGVGISRDCSTLMVAQYFKKKREFVEIFIVSGSGLGLAIMSAIIKITISGLGWRLGLQLVTGIISIMFILGTFYRSASLYHPQRRAILHIKNQKRKIKDKNKLEHSTSFFDFSTLKSKTVRILLFSTGVSAFGINTPLFNLANQAEEEGLGDFAMLLQIYLGLAWTVGCIIFSTLVLYNSSECRIARQYLCQTAMFMCGLSILAFTVVSGNYRAYVIFAWAYGIFYGGYHYSLKMYTYERVRARNFARTWGFVQFSQAIPIVTGILLSGYINDHCGDGYGNYFSSACVIIGSLTLLLIDLHHRKVSRLKSTGKNRAQVLCIRETCPQRHILSQEHENDQDTDAALVLSNDLINSGGINRNMLVSGDKGELTCISEEGIADMDLPDHLLDDLHYIRDYITSCNKVENDLMLSEFENNLIAEMPFIFDRQDRRWSLDQLKMTQNKNFNGSETPFVDENMISKIRQNGSDWKIVSNKIITIIDEPSF